MILELIKVTTTGRISLAQPGIRPCSAAPCGLSDLQLPAWPASRWACPIGGKARGAGSFGLPFSSILDDFSTLLLDLLNLLFIHDLLFIDDIDKGYIIIIIHIQYI